MGDIIKAILKAVLITIFVTIIGGAIAWVCKSLCELWKNRKG